jgi:hypothetical protein
MPRRAAGTLQRSDWRRTLAAALWTATTIMAAVIVSRRLGGHIADGLHPVPTTALVALLTGLNMAAAALLNSAAAGSATPVGPRWTATLAVFLATLVPPFAMGVFLLAIGSATGFSALVTLTLLCAVAMLVWDSEICILTSADEQQGDRAETLRPVKAIDQFTATRELEITESPETEAHETDEPFPLDEFGEADADDSAVGDGQAFSQSMSRATQSDGSETIEGTVALRFDAGQQIGVVHLPFCPPLAGQPEVSCYLLEDRPVRLRVTATHTYGVRLEARRIETTSGPEEIVVGYTVSASAIQARAA